MTTAGKRLVVNADDFGFTRDVNEGILEAHRRGILTSTTLMANGEAADHAVQMAAGAPALDIGCHLVLVGGRSLVDGSEQPRSLAALAARLAVGRVKVHAEFDAQVRHIVEAGIRPSHLDTHKHTHLLPEVLEAVARVSRDYAIPWVRRPFDLPLPREVSREVGAATRLRSRLLGAMEGRFSRVLAGHGCRSTEHFSGIQVTGRLGTSQLVALIRALPEGTTELMCHPGYCRAELRGGHTRLKESRERELEALTSQEARAALAECGVALVSFRDLEGGLES